MCYQIPSVKMLVCAFTMADLNVLPVPSGLNRLANGNLVIGRVIFDYFIGLVVVVFQLSCT